MYVTLDAQSFMPWQECDKNHCFICNCPGPGNAVPYTKLVFPLSPPLGWRGVLCNIQSGHFPSSEGVFITLCVGLTDNIY